MPPRLTAQPQTLFCTVASFHGAVKTKSEKKARPKSLLPAVGLEGNTEREESLYMAVETGELRAWHSSLVSLWNWCLQGHCISPEAEGSESAVLCVCVCVRGSEQLDREFSDQAQPQHSWNHFNCLQQFAVVVPVCKWICWVRWLVHLEQQPCLFTPSVLQQQDQYLGWGVVMASNTGAKWCFSWLAMHLWVVGPALDMASGVHSGERQCQGSCRQECDDSACLSQATSGVAACTRSAGLDFKVSL